MKYVYGKRMVTLRDRVVSVVASIAMLGNSMIVAIPFINTARIGATASVSTEACSTYTSVHTTNLNTWDLSKTRSAGHNQLTADGLSIWTDTDVVGSTDPRKAAGYYSTDFSLSGLGNKTIAESIDYQVISGTHVPGLQLVVDFDNNGSTDGILVGEAVYGNDWWLSEGDASVKNNSPNTGGGNGSEWYGKIDQWLVNFPTARVKSIGYSLGSGVNASGVIKKISLGCVDYTFGVAPLAKPSNLRYENPAVACGGYTNINWTTARWEPVAEAVSYDYQALFNGNIVYTNNFTSTSNTGSFGGGQNGVWGFQVRSVAASGVTSEWSDVCSITLDTINPGVPTHVSPASNSLINYNDFYFEWTDVEGVSEYEFQSSQNPALNAEGALYSGVWNNKANGAPDRDHLTDSSIHSYGANGTWYWQVRTIDAAGNKSPWTSPWKLTIDIEKPDVFLISPEDNSVTNGAGVTQSWGSNATDVNHFVYESYHDAAGTNLRWRESFNTTSKTAYNVADSTYWWRVMSVDNAGNESAWTSLRKLTIDNSAPLAPILRLQVNGIDVLSGSTTNLADVNALWNKPSSDTTRYVYQYWNDISGNSYKQSSPWQTDVLSENRNGSFTEGEGKHFIRVRAIDAANNESDWSNIFEINYDKTAPNIPSAVFNQDSDGMEVLSGGTTNSQFFTFALDSSSETTRYQLKYWNDISGSPFKESSPWSLSNLGGYSPSLGVYKDNFTQGDGNHYFSFSACDEAGNCSAFSAPFEITYDNTAPLVTIDTLSESTNTTPLITGTVNDPGAQVYVSINGGAVVLATNNGTTWELQVSPALNTGAHSVTAYAMDNTGNTTNPQPSLNFTIASVQGVTTDTPSTPNNDQNEQSSQPPSQASGSAQSNNSPTSRRSASSNQPSDGIADGTSTAVLAQTTDDEFTRDVDAAQDQINEAQTLATGDVSEDKSKECSKIFGICWYWWIPVAVIVVLVIYYVGRGNSNKD